MTEKTMITSVEEIVMKLKEQGVNCNKLQRTGPTVYECSGIMVNETANCRIEIQDCGMGKWSVTVFKQSAFIIFDS